MTRLLSALMIAIIVLSSSLLSGCGFRLQGQYQYPELLKHVQLQSNDRYGELHRLLQENLRLHNIQVVTDEQAPLIWLYDDSLERSTLSLFPSGQVAEYELIYSVAFYVKVPTQEAQPFAIEVRRSYLDDPRTALAKNRELEDLLKEMRRSASERILRHLATIQVTNEAVEASYRLNSQP